MNILSKIKFSLYIINSRGFAIKKATKQFIKNTEVYELSTNKSKNNFLGVFGFARTGALGISKLITNERPFQNIAFARRVYPLYYFNESENIPKLSVKKVAAGYGFTLFSGKSSLGWQVFGCGINNDSQLGLQRIGTNSNDYSIVSEPSVINLPVKVNSINLMGCGQAHSVIIATVETSDKLNNNNQIIYTFGNNQFGQCGREIIENEIFKNSSVIHTITSFSKPIKQVECGEFTTFLLTEDGLVYGCGSNHCGELANKEIQKSPSFIQINGGLEKKVVRQISCRCNTVLALTEDNQVWAWGNNEHDLIFTETDNSFVTTPVRLDLPETVKMVTRVSAGNTVCAIVDNEGQVHTWGIFINGLGPNQGIVKQPTIIPAPFFGGGSKILNNDTSKVVNVVCGTTYCAAITSFGSLYVWGHNCIEKETIQTFPVRIPVMFNVKEIFMGADHTIIKGGHTM